MRKLTLQEQQFIIKNYLIYSQRVLAKMMGRSKHAIATVMRKNNLTIPKELANKRRAQGHLNKTTSTPQIDQYLRENYLKINVKQIAVSIEKSGTFVSTRLRQLGLTIPLQIIEARKVESQFKQGQEPCNKGKKQSEYMTPQQIEATKKTRFKKGNIPHNTYKEDGVIVVRKSKGIPYKYIRISKANWKMLHVHKWEKENGPVPPDKIVVFIDGNQGNCDLANLKISTREENMLRNSKKQYPEEIVKIRTKLVHLKKIIKQIEN